MAETAEKIVHKSRWGYHPVSYEASRKLRDINRAFAKAQHSAGAWLRWQRKAEWNRVVRGKGGRPVLGEDGKPVPMGEPKVNPAFHEAHGSVQHQYWVTPAKVVSTGLGEAVLHWSRSARTPAATPEDVHFLPWTEEEIDAMWRAVKD